ncbi:MAG: hypothetical protein H7249_11490 [Chitinophagaceae bacterium]|nr:hypothetical protein [Oligoflexus sp.]
MSGKESINVQSTNDGLLLSGSNFQDGKTWQARALGKSRFLLDQAGQGPMMSGDKAGFGVMERNSYVALLQGLVQQRYDGIISIDIGTAIKRLFFRKGELVFAGSNLMDDRLGEVLYREGLITLDQLTEAAVQVNRTTKFGKVLIDSEVFSCTQLWDALRLQVTSIFQSTFLQEYIYLQLEAGEQHAPMMVTLDRPTDALIDDSFGYASMIYQFRRRIDGKGRLKRVEGFVEKQDAVPGTFIGDTIELAAVHGGIAEFLEHSKLTEINSLCAIFDLVHRHIFTIENFDASTRNIDVGSGLKEIKSLLDAYHLILDGARKAFTAENLKFPVREIELFLDRQYSLRRSPLFVLPDGNIGMESVVGVYSRAQSSQRQCQYMVSQIQAVVRFLLQLVGDLLPGGKGWEVKKSFQSMVT